MAPHGFLKPMAAPGFQIRGSTVASAGGEGTPFEIALVQSSGRSFSRAVSLIFMRRESVILVGNIYALRRETLGTQSCL